jgi:hypothetical protein
MSLPPLLYTIPKSGTYLMKKLLCSLDIPAGNPMKLSGDVGTVIVPFAHVKIKQNLVNGEF